MLIALQEFDAHYNKHINNADCIIFILRLLFNLRCESVISGVFPTQKGKFILLFGIQINGYNRQTLIVEHVVLCPRRQMWLLSLTDQTSRFFSTLAELNYAVP